MRNSGQLVNIVLLEVQASSSISAETGATYFHDGTLDPIGSLSYSGQRGALNYLLSGAVSSGYELQESSELSVLADGRLNETRLFDRQREQTNYSVNSNLVYQISDVDRVSLNALYGESDPPATLLRTITDLKTTPNNVRTLCVDRDWGARDEESLPRRQ